MSGKKVLIVDDEEHLRILVKEVLELEGFKVSTVKSGVACLEKLKKMKPDLIIMDMMMPKLSGFETIKEIRKNEKLKDTKIVVLTVSKVADAAKFELSKYNVSDYITKPFDNKQLVERIKKVL